MTSNATNIRMVERDKGVFPMPDETENLILHVLADEQQEQFQSYLQRGRYLQVMDDDDLRAQFVSEMRSWASNPPPWDPLIRLDDIKAEAGLRNLELPWDLVADHLHTIRTYFDEFMSQNLPTTGHLDQKIAEHYKRSEN